MSTYTGRYPSFDLLDVARQYRLHAEIVREAAGMPECNVVLPVFTREASEPAGYPDRQKFPNRAAFRKALSEWRRTRG